MNENDRDGIFVNNDFNNIGILMYADDVTDVADLPIKLQRKLNQLELFCKQWCMFVNLEKTKVIVFRNGGILKGYERWCYNG